MISNPFSLGYGGALQTGYKFAVKNGYHLLVQLDGDGQHDPACIDETSSNRFEAELLILPLAPVFLLQTNEGTADRSGHPLPGWIGMKDFRYHCHTFLIKQKVTDPTSGYQAMSRRVFTILSGDTFPIDYPDADVIIMLHRAGFRIREVPVRMFPSPDDKSMHSGLKPLYYIFKMFLSILVTLLRK